MKTKHIKNGIHAQRMRAIRKYVEFDYDLRKPLTKYAKQKIKTYFDEIDQLTARPFHAYQPKTKQRLKTAQEFAQHQKRLPALKVAFIPTNGERVKIRFNKGGELTVDTDHVHTRFIPFDPHALIKDPKAHVNSVIADDSKSKAFSVLAGAFEIPKTFSRSLVAENVAKMAAKYANVEANNYFGNWMVGLNAHSFKRQAELFEYTKAKEAAKRKLQSERRNKKTREKRAKLKKK